MRYDFEWNPVKAITNLRNHKVSFERGSTVFRDPNAISMFDEDHSNLEERWITIGLDETGILLVVSHTFKATQDAYKLRIISVRKATKSETKQYGLL